MTAHFTAHGVRCKGEPAFLLTGSSFFFFFLTERFSMLVSAKVAPRVSKTIAVEKVGDDDVELSILGSSGHVVLPAADLCDALNSDEATLEGETSRGASFLATLSRKRGGAYKLKLSTWRSATFDREAVAKLRSYLSTP